MATAFHSSSLAANEDNVTIRADRVGTYDGKNLEDSLTFSVFEEGIIDLNGEISSTYESETGKENNRITISDGEDNLFTMNVDSTVDELEKGKSLHGTIDSAEFTSLNGQYSVVFSGEGYLRPLEGDNLAMVLGAFWALWPALAITLAVIVGISLFFQLSSSFAVSSKKANANSFLIL